VPASTDRAHYVQKVLIEKRNPEADQPWRERMVKAASGGRQIYLDHYDADRGNMGGVVILVEKDGCLLSRIDASGGRYEPEGWVLYNGIQRSFGPDGMEATLHRFRRLPLPDLKEKPFDFVVESNQREEDLLLFSSTKLLRIIHVLRATGADSRREEACLHVRLAYPLACFVLALLGCSIPFLFPYGRRAVAGAAIGLLATLAAGMLYLVCIQVGVSLGTDGVLAPVVGAWIGNAVFASLGGLALWRANR
jgi:lipopolysaccharide export system permease protein